MLFSVKVFSFALYDLNLSTSQITQASILIAHAMVLQTSLLWKGYESSSNVCQLLFVLVTVVHLFKARLRQPGFFNLCKVMRPFKNLGMMS